MLDITLIEDLARTELNEVPPKVLTLTNLKMLYLESNNLQEIPDNLFKYLNQLSWLDIRNNQVKTIPTSIEYHPNLETFLLQNNKIEIIPVQVGFVPKLQVLQISGNPITYPKKSVIEQGVEAIIKFLQNEHAKQKLDAIVSATSTSDNVNQNMREIKCIINEKSASSKSIMMEKDEIPIITLKSYHKFVRRSPRKKSKSKKLNKIQSKSSIYSFKDKPYSNSNKSLNKLPHKKSNVRISDQFLKDLWMKNLKETMTRQQNIIQKEHDRQVLKNWRENLKNQDKNVDLHYRPEVPYDYDKKYDQIPTRYELIYKRIQKKNKRIIPQNKPKHINIGKMITDIIESLKQMEAERKIEKTPEEQMDYAGREIRKILDLQKRISALKIQNDKSV